MQPEQQSRTIVARKRYGAASSFKARKRCPRSLAPHLSQAAWPLVAVKGGKRASPFASRARKHARKRRPGLLPARRFRCRLACPAALFEIRILLLARRHDLWVDLRQSVGGLLSLWRTFDNWSDTIHHEPGALGTVGYKARPHTCRRDLDAWSRRRLSGSRLNRLRGFGQQGVQQPDNEETS